MTTHLTAPMCTVPAGILRRGSVASPDEQPDGDIELSAYRIDETPVINAAFAAFIQDDGYRRPSLWTPAGWAFVQTHQLEAPNYWDDPLWSDPAVPVTGVSWWEALAFARWMDKMLPTEARWEYACKGRANNTYPWGEDYPDPGLANYAPDGEPIERRPTPPFPATSRSSVYVTSPATSPNGAWTTTRSDTAPTAATRCI